MRNLNKRKNNLNKRNVGINITTPSTLLHLGGAVGSFSNGLSFGDGDSGIYENGDDVLRFTFSNSDRFQISQASFTSTTDYGGWVGRDASSSTNPGLAFRSDDDTGMGRAAENENLMFAELNVRIRISYDAS